MSILETEVLTTITGRTAKYYEEKGYLIPKFINNKGKEKIDINAEILVKIGDLKEGSNIKVTKVCDDCGVKIPNQQYSSITNKRNLNDGKDRCRECGNKYNWKNRKNSIKYEKSLKYWAKEHNKEYLLDEWSESNEKTPIEVSYGTNDEYLWNCPECKSEYPMKVKERKSGNNCPYCSGRRVNLTNCLWTTHPDIAKLLVNEEIGYSVTYCHTKKIEMKCPDCGHIEPKSVVQATNKGFSCSVCSDGISRPEKFMISLLKQLDVDFDTQIIFEWSKNIIHKNKKLCGKKKYDFYLKDYNSIIETHGKQHYEEGFVDTDAKSLAEEQENDNIKERLAKENGIKHYIVIDCFNVDMEYIKNSILMSKLAEMFDLSNVDWLECHKFACSSLIKEACELWNNGFTNKEIVNELNINRQTVRKYLKYGSLIGICNFDNKESRRRSKEKANLPTKAVVQLTEDGEFIAEFNSINEAVRKLKINQSGISNVCNGFKVNFAGGFRWMFKEEYEANNAKVPQIERKLSHNAKTIMKLSMNGEFINEYKCISDAAKENSVQPNGIHLSCKGKLKQSGGFRWMYKEEYEKLKKEENEEKQLELTF